LLLLRASCGIGGATAGSTIGPPTQGSWTAGRGERGLSNAGCSSSFVRLFVVECCRVLPPACMVIPFFNFVTPATTHCRLPRRPQESALVQLRCRRASYSVRKLAGVPGMHSGQ
jgi:hypothetical protein